MGKTQSRGINAIVVGGHSCSYFVLLLPRLLLLLVHKKTCTWYVAQRGQAGKVHHDKTGRDLTRSEKKQPCQHPSPMTTYCTVLLLYCQYVYCTARKSKGSLRYPYQYPKTVLTSKDGAVLGSIARLPFLFLSLLPHAQNALIKNHASPCTVPFYCTATSTVIVLDHSVRNRSKDHLFGIHINTHNRPCIKGRSGAWLGRPVPVLFPPLSLCPPRQTLINHAWPCMHPCTYHTIFFIAISTTLARRQS